MLLPRKCAKLLFSKRPTRYVVVVLTLTHNTMQSAVAGQAPITLEWKKYVRVPGSCGQLTLYIPAEVMYDDDLECGFFYGSKSRASEVVGRETKRAGASCAGAAFDFIDVMTWASVAPTDGPSTRAPPVRTLYPSGMAGTYVHTWHVRKYMARTYIPGN